MKNSVIPVRIQMERSISVVIFRIKDKFLPRYYWYYLFFQLQWFFSRKREKFSSILLMVQLNPIPIFCAKITVPVAFLENFHRNFIANGKNSMSKVAKISLNHNVISVLCPSSGSLVFSKQFAHITRSCNRGRRLQARGPRGSIEIVKCAIFRTNCATLNVMNLLGNLHIAGGRVEFQKMSDHLTTLFECSLNFPSSLLYMHAQWRNEPMLYKHY